MQDMKVPIFYPKYCIYTNQVCTTFWIRRLTGTNGNCIYDINGICATVHMHAFRWSPKTHFELQKDVRMYEKIKIYSLGI